jgi:predicted nucleotidyltransferase
MAGRMQLGVTVPERGDTIVRAKSAPVVDALAKIPEVQSILCYGSYAMGTFDQQSDIDLYVVCNPAVVSAEVRRSAFEKIAAIQNLEIGVKQAGWDAEWHPEDDRFRVGETVFDITYNTVDWVRGVVHAVKEHGITTSPEFGFRAYTMLGLLEYSIVLYDPTSMLETIKASLKPYPAKLRQALLAEHIPRATGSLEDLQDYVNRSIGNTAFHFHVERLLDSLLTILFAINERYDPATKRTEEFLATLDRLPDRFLERYSRILKTPLTDHGRREIVVSFASLLTEVQTLASSEQST